MAIGTGLVAGGFGLTGDGCFLRVGIGYGLSRTITRMVAALIIIIAATGGKASSAAAWFVLFS
ncbi:MAG TPA: hypothetical protein VN774_08985 [Candidatus Limnocylindrales bacterium]|nr:hypothetical protein [Candidatus Limnocylindrales bacterium]